MNEFEQTDPPVPMMKRAAMQVAAFGQNKWVIFTQKFLVVLVGVIIVVDLYLAFNDTPGDTISNVLRDWAYRRFFVVTWIWGVLAGHLFLTNAHPFLASNIAILLLLGLTLVLFIVGRFFYDGLVGIQVQLVLLVLGAIAGYVLWPQTPVV